MASAFGGVRTKAKSPEKGVFPLDHFAECKEVGTEDSIVSACMAGWVLPARAEALVPARALGRLGAPRPPLRLHPTAAMQRECCIRHCADLILSPRYCSVFVPKWHLPAHGHSVCKSRSANLRPGMRTGDRDSAAGMHTTRGLGVWAHQWRMHDFRLRCLKLTDTCACHVLPAGGSAVPRVPGGARPGRKPVHRAVEGLPHMPHAAVSPRQCRE